MERREKADGVLPVFGTQVGAVREEHLVSGAAVWQLGICSLGLSISGCQLHPGAEPLFFKWVSRDREKPGTVPLVSRCSREPPVCSCIALMSYAG